MLCPPASSTPTHPPPPPPLLQALLVRYIGALRGATAAQTDERVRLTSEVIGGILATKMLGGWVTHRLMIARRGVGGVWMPQC